MRSAAYEQVLKSEGVEFNFLGPIQIDQIDWKASLDNQARLHQPIKEDLIENYREMIKEGHEPPAVVVYCYPKHKSKYVLMDGIQRVESLRRERKKKVDAYEVLTADPMVIDRITWTFNNKVNGGRLSYDESLEHALAYMLKYGYPATVAAKQWGVNSSTLSKRLASSKIREAVNRAGERMPGNLGDGVMEKLSPLLSVGDDVVASAIRVAAQSGMSRAQAGQLTSNVKQAKTLAQKMKVIEEFGKSREILQRAAETKGGRISRSLPARTRFMDALRKLNNLMTSYLEDESLRPPLGEEFDSGKVASGVIVGRLESIFNLRQSKVAKEA